jgi:transcriptional regulator with XRE-family HTH domain
MKGNFLILGRYLAEKRLEKGLSQAAVARTLGYSSAQFISNFERGVCAPPMKKLKKMIDMYGMSPNKVTILLLDAQEEYIRKVLVPVSKGKSASA